MLGWGGEVEDFSGAVVEAGGDGVEIVLAERGKGHGFGEILTQQAVGVLVGTALPRRVRVGEEDAHGGGEGQALVVGHFLALVVGQRLAQRCRNGVQGAGERTGSDIGLARWHVNQNNKAGGALNQGANGAGTPCTKYEIALPMAGHQSTFDFFRPLLDVCHVAELAATLTAFRLAATTWFVLTQTKNKVTAQPGCRDVCPRSVALIA